MSTRLMAIPHVSINICATWLSRKKNRGNWPRILHWHLRFLEYIVQMNQILRMCVIHELLKVF